MLARFCVLTRLKEHENSNLYSKLRVYDGEKLKDTDPKAKTLQEYKDAAGVDEGMSGISTRFAYKVLSETFNYDTTEITADPVHLMYVLEQAIKREQYADDTEKRYLEFIKAELAPRYAEFIGKEIQKAYLESYSEYGQNLFDRYIAYADAWIEDQDFKDPDTGQMMDRSSSTTSCRRSKSRPASPTRRTSATRSSSSRCATARRTTARTRRGRPTRRSATSSRSGCSRQVEDLLPVISFESKKDSDTQSKHNEFVKRMLARHYTAAPGAAPRRVVYAGEQGGLGRSESDGVQPGGSGHGELHRPASQSRRAKALPTGSASSAARAREIKEAVQKSLKDRTVSDFAKDQKISIPTKSTKEPRFRHDPAAGGEHERVLPGNKEFVEGDQIKKPRQGDGQGRGKDASTGGECEDDFSFTLSQDEILDIFFEDLELPNLIKTSLKEIKTLHLAPGRDDDVGIAEPDQSGAHDAQFVRAAAGDAPARRKKRSRRCASA